MRFPAFSCYRLIIGTVASIGIVAHALLAPSIARADVGSERPAVVDAATRPSGPIRPDHRKGLTTAMLETKLLPLPDGFGGDSDEFGASVSASGSKVLVGGPGIQTTGAVLVFEETQLGWRLEAVLRPSDPDPFDNFGVSVSLDGNRALIGANIDSEFVPNAGAAYVFEFDGSTWNETAKLTADVPIVNDLFGTAVSLDGDRALIGAPVSFLVETEPGSAYVFDFDGTNWSQSARLVAPAGAAEDRFGRSVSLDGDRVLIGSSLDDDLGMNAGAALVFDFDGMNWNFTTQLLAADGAAFDAFGSVVSLSGNEALVGAPGKDRGAVDNAGAAYLFSFDGTAWNQSEKLTPRSSDANDRFGSSVDLAPGRAAIGATGDLQSGIETGAAYLFEFARGAWSETARLVASGGAEFDDFGGAIALSGNVIVVGAPKADPLGSASGSAFLFESDGSAWNERVEFVPPEGASGAAFGRSVSLDGTRALIGAPFAEINGQNSGTAFIAEYDGTDWQVTARLEAADNGIGDRFGGSVALEGNRALVAADFDDDGGPQAGAVYVFEFNGTSWVESEKLIAADAEADAYFGVSVDLSGDRALVGAYFDDSATGAAYVFDFDGTNWNQSIKLTAIGGDPGDQFGRSVALDGNRALIGAPLDNDNGPLSGSVYVFDRFGLTWIQSAKLTPGDGVVDARFGEVVALSGSQAVIAAPQDDENGLLSGSVYVFDLDGVTWNQTAKVVSPELDSQRFGESLGFDGARLVVGERFESTLASQAGAAFVFDFDGSTWQPTEMLLAPDGVASDQFGAAVAVDADRVLVGAPGTDVRGAGSGSAYVLRLNRSPIARLDEIDGLEDIVLTGNVLADNGNGADSDPDGDSLTVTTTGTFATVGLGGDVVLSANGDFTYTPPADLSGAAMFSYTVADPDGATATNSVVLRIRPVNDAPSFTTGTIPPVLEDSGQATIPRWATFSAGPPNEVQGLLQYSVSNISNPDLFSAYPGVDTTGALSFTPSTNAFGTSTFDLVVQDDGGTLNGGVDTSPPQTFTITVLPVNDPPDFQGAGNVIGYEDTPFLDTWAIGIVPGPLNESGQTVSFSTVVQTNPGLFQGTPTVDEFGVLSFTPAPDALGPATVEVTAIDDGGNDNGGDPVGTRVQFNVDIRRATDLTIDKTSGTSYIEPGGDVTYTIVVSNPGPSDVFQATVFDLPPPRLGDVTWTCTATVGASCPPAGTVEINAPVDLPEGTSVTFLLDARLLDTLYEPITNTARVITPAGPVELNEANNIDRDTDRVGLFIDSFESDEP